MLPPAHLYTTCLRCQAPLDADALVCARCGADPVVEREVYAQLAPAIRELRLIFLLAFLFNAVGAWLVYDHLARHGVHGFDVVAPALITSGVLAVLWILAPRAPLACALVGGFVVAGDWVREIIRAPGTALDPTPVTAIRALVVLAFYFAIRAGLTARTLRRRRDAGGVPTATARPR
jgi:hypothetical protein